jgi:hypothetical protein
MEREGIFSTIDVLIVVHNFKMNEDHIDLIKRFGRIMSGKDRLSMT